MLILKVNLEGQVMCDKLAAIAIHQFPTMTYRGGVPRQVRPPQVRVMLYVGQEVSTCDKVVIIRYIENSLKIFSSHFFTWLHGLHSERAFVCP